MKNLFTWILPCACIILLAFATCSNDNVGSDGNGEIAEPPLVAQPTPISFLKTNGTVLCNEAGDTIQLKGTNLGSYISLEQWMSPVGTGHLSRDKWNLKVSSSDGANPSQNIIDNKNNTYWSPSPTSTLEQEWITIDFGEEVVFNVLRFDIRCLNNDASYDLGVYKSNDGSGWELIGNYKGQVNSDNLQIGMGDFFMAKYLKINVKSQEYKNWKITELNLSMNDDYHIRKALIDRFGVKEADNLWDHYCNNWIKESDLELIRSMGMNVVRVPFFWMEIMDETGNIKDNAFRHLDWIIKECNKRNIYVILDFHCSPGGNDGYVTSGMAGYNNLWHSSEYQQMTLNIWRAIAERYRDEPTIACYDALNESWSTSSEMTLNNFYKQIYSTIRSVDNRHVICFQGFPSFEFVSSPVQNGWENVMYQAHYYNTDYKNEASQDGFAIHALSEMIRYQQRWNVPVLAGEFSFWEHEKVWKKFLVGMNSMHASWTNWSYKSRESNSSRANFAFYTDLTVGDPDILLNSADEIKSVWSKITSGNFVKNTPFINLIKGVINRDSQISATPIYIKQWDGTFLKLSDNGELSFSVIDSKDASKFYIEKQAKGGIAIKAPNGNYLSVDRNSKIIFCSQAVRGEYELFHWIDLTNSEFALWGYHGFVSCNGGNANLTSDRDAIDGWERFTWTVASN